MSIRKDSPIDSRAAEEDGVMVRDGRIVATHNTEEPMPKRSILQSVQKSERLTDEETQEYRELTEQAKGMNTIFAYFTGRLARKYRLDLQRDSLTEQGEIIRHQEAAAREQPAAPEETEAV